MDTAPENELSNAEMLKSAIVSFRTGLELRTEIDIRVARRVTKVVRVGMISLGLISLAVLFLMVTLSFHINGVIDAIDTMNRHFISISKDMVVMRETLKEMDHNVNSLPVMVDNMVSMQHSVTNMGGSVSVLSDKMGSINGQMQQMNADVAKMTMTFQQMDDAVYRIGLGVNSMAKPAKTMNSFLPFP